MFETKSNAESIVDVIFTTSNELLSLYQFYSDVCSNEKVSVLSNRESHDHKIILKEDSFSTRAMYNLSLVELKILKNYVDDNLVKEFIIHNTSRLRVSILFIKKKNDSLRLCVNYRSLNVVIIKNKYSLSLIQKLFDIVSESTIYTKLNLRNVYNNLRIVDENE